MACYEQLSPSTVLLSPLLGMEDTDSFYSSRDESNAGGAVVASSAAQAASSSLKRALSLSSISSTSKDPGSATTLIRPSKRRKSRAKPQAHITQLSASKLNFKDIVHQFTGAPSSKPPFKQISSCRPQYRPSNTQNNGAICDLQPMPSAIAHASLSEKDAAFLAGAVLAQSLRTLDTISSYLLQPNSPLATQDTTSTQKTVNTSCNGEHANNARRSVAELENFLLKGDSKLDNFFSLSCLLLKQIASQCGALSQR